MIRQTHDFIEEPRSDVWRRLLRALARHASCVQVVVRTPSGMTADGAAFVDRIRPHLLAETTGSSWPGTTLVGSEATLLRFSSNETVVAEMLNAADGLYDWSAPNLPEDVALLRSDGTPLLASIAHELDAFLELSEGEYQSLVNDVPEIATLTVMHDGP